MIRRTFDHKGYPCEPTDLDERAWYYVQKDGVVVCHRGNFGDPAEVAVIPWRLLKRALADHEKANGRRAPVEDAGKP